MILPSAWHHFIPVPGNLEIRKFLQEQEFLLTLINYRQNCDSYINTRNKPGLHRKNCKTNFTIHIYIAFNILLVYCFRFR